MYIALLLNTSAAHAIYAGLQVTEFLESTLWLLFGILSFSADRHNNTGSSHPVALLTL
jgi:hypothetical protein